MNRGFIGALCTSVATALLTGCGGSQPAIGAPGMMERSDAAISYSLEHQRSIENATGASAANAYDFHPRDGRAHYLFVANLDDKHDNNHSLGRILQYQQGVSQPIATITKGIDAPNGLAINARGDLIVANNGSGRTPGSVTIYKANTGTLIRTITKGVATPDAIALDASGNLYVGNYLSNTVTEYASGSKIPLRTISNGIGRPDHITMGRDGNVYVSNYSTHNVYTGTVTEYSGETGKLLGTITDGIAGPAGTAFDDNGNLFVANNGINSVSVYDHRLKLTKQITDGLNHPSELAFDQRGALYVENPFANLYGNVAVYSPGASHPEVTITTGLEGPRSLRLGWGKLFVSNGKGCVGSDCSLGAISVYSTQNFRLVRQVTNGINNAGAIALSSDR